MPNDPGPTVQLQVTPVGAASNQQPAQTIQGSYDQPATYTQQQTYAQPQTYVQPQIQTQTIVQPYSYVTPYPVTTYAPSYYQPYYAPLGGVSLSFGYRGGYGYHGGGRPRHWR